MTVALIALAAAIWLVPGRAGAGARGGRHAPVADAVGIRFRWKVERPPAHELRWLALLLDLTAAGLVAGLPVDSALVAAAPARLPWLGGRLRQVAARLRLGAEASHAWQPLAAEPRLAPLVATAVRSATSGIKLAASLGELAADLRAGDRAASLVRAQRAGVWVILPLGLCFLPAFVCLGVLPVVIAIATTLTHGAGR